MEKLKKENKKLKFGKRDIALIVGFILVMLFIVSPDNTNNEEYIPPVKTLDVDFYTKDGEPYVSALVESGSPHTIEKVSVEIPVYNKKGEYLGECFASTPRIKPFGRWEYGAYFMGDMKGTKPEDIVFKAPKYNGF